MKKLMATLAVAALAIVDVSIYETDKGVVVKAHMNNGKNCTLPPIKRKVFYGKDPRFVGQLLSAAVYEKCIKQKDFD